MGTAIQLYFEFFKTGLFAVGGGLATLPFLYAMSGSTGWFTKSDIADMIAVSESTPGAMGVNMATYVGFATLGIFGGIVSTLGLITPSIIVIICVARILDKFKNSIIVQRVFYGLRPASTALIAAAGLGVAKIALLNIDLYESSGVLLDLFNWKCILLAAACLAIYKIFKPHPVVVILGAAICGVVFSL